MEGSKTKIAILHYTAPPIVGGVETVIKAHAQLFDAKGYQVKIIAGRGVTPQDQKVVVAEGIETIIEPLIDSKNDRINKLNQGLDRGEIPEDFARLEDAIFERLKTLLADCTACIIHNVLTLHKNLALTAALFRLADTIPVKFIAWCHDLAWTNPLYLPVLYPHQPWTLLKTAHPAIIYVAISPQRQQEILDTLQPKLPLDQIPIVPNGVALEEFLGVDTTTTAILKAANLDVARQEKAIIFLLPSRITRRKNIELAIEVIAALKTQGYQTRLIITGPPGPHNPKNDEYVQELIILRQRLNVVKEVIFLIECWLDQVGNPQSVDDSTIAALYRYCDAMLMPSSQEGFGIPILEAALARMPIFCTKLDPFQELALQDVTYFELADNPSQIAAQILQQLETDATFRLRQRILTNYSWDSIFQQKIEPLILSV